METFRNKIKEDIAIFINDGDVYTKDYLNILNPKLLPVFIFRVSRLFYEKGLEKTSNMMQKINFWIFKCDISKEADIQGGLYIPKPKGVVIRKNVKIGKNCMVFEGVKIGGEDNLQSLLKIGDYVEIRSGAKLLGKVEISKFARVCSNSIVLSDIPKRGIAYGVPAKIIDYRDIL